MCLHTHTIIFPHYPLCVHMLACNCLYVCFALGKVLIFKVVKIFKEMCVHVCMICLISLQSAKIVSTILYDLSREVAISSPNLLQFELWGEL